MDPIKYVWKDRKRIFFGFYLFDTSHIYIITYFAKFLKVFKDLLH